MALDTWQTQTVTRGPASLRITSLPGRHAPGPLQALLPPVMGSLLEFRPDPQASSVRVYITGDTLCYDGLAEIARRHPDIDFGIWHLGGTKILGVLVTMDGKQGVDLLGIIRPRVAVPVHFEEYGVMTSPLSDFQAEVARRRPTTAVSYVERGGTMSFG